MTDEYLDIPLHLLRGRDPVYVVERVRFADRLTTALIARWQARRGSDAA